MTRFALPFLLIAFTAAAETSYIIAVSERTAADPAWKPVVDKLTTKHHASILKWRGTPEGVLTGLREAMPRFTCFVARPEEATREFVQGIHRLTRRLDDDPYTDTRWGILTGYDAANALAIASEEKPLVIHNVGSGTEVALDRCEAGTWYCELRKGHMVRKNNGGAAQELKVEADTTKALVDLINAGAPDLWITSGHATERDWMIGFRYRNGFWKSKAGQLFGEDTKGGRTDVQSPNPKVYLPVGNCLIGHIDGPDAMALAYMKSAGVRQMPGYVLPTWYGYQGWGLLDYFVEQPGRFTLTEAFHANNLALVHRLLKYFPGAEKVERVDPMGRTPPGIPLPALTAAATAAGLTAQDLRGLLFDRDNVAFYGDPAWEARMAPGRLNWEQKLVVTDDGTHTFTVTPIAGAASWEPVNRNGSQRGGRPIIQYLPQRIDPAKVKIISGSEFEPVITDDFLLIPLPAKGETPLTVQFRVDARTGSN
jgi:zinc protease